MSVPEGKRAKTQPSFILQAEDLLLYTLQITKNKKVFTDDYFDSVTAPIIETAQTIYYNAFEANLIYVRGDADAYLKRRDKQKVAISMCNRLLAQMKIAQRVYHFKTKRLKYWGQRTVDLRKTLQGWMDSDKRRYGELIQEQ